MQYIVDNKDNGIRLDKFLALKEADLSRTLIQKIINEEQVKVNGKPEKASYKINKDDIIEFNIPKAKETNIIAENIDLNII